MSQPPSGGPPEAPNSTPYAAALNAAGLNMLPQQLQAALHAQQLQQHQVQQLQQQLNAGISIQQLQQIGQAQAQALQQGSGQSVQLSNIQVMQQLMATNPEVAHHLMQQMHRQQGSAQNRQQQAAQQAQQAAGAAAKAQSHARAPAASHAQQPPASQQPPAQPSHSQQQSQAQQMPQPQQAQPLGAHPIAAPIQTSMPPPRPASALSVGGPPNPASSQPQSQQQKTGGQSGAQPVQPGGPARIADAAPAVKRSKKRKAPPTALPAKAAKLGGQILEVLPESAVFTALQEMERQVDGFLAERRSELVDSLRSPPQIPKRLRLSIHSQYLDQNAATRVGDPPSWQLYITGQVLDVAEAEGLVPPEQPPTQPAWKPKTHPFLYCVKSLSVVLEPEQYPDDGVVTWTRDNHEGDFKDQVEIRRKGRSDVKVTIKLELHNQPERFEVSESLGNVLGIRTGSRAQVLSALWLYIRQRKLLGGRAGQVELDEKLQAIMGIPSCNMSVLSQKIERELQPLQPLELAYTVKVSGENPSKADVYDVDMEIPAQGDGELPPNLEKLNRDAELQLLDQKVSLLIRGIREHMRRRAFLLGFSTSPVGVINALVASQARDLRTAQISPGPRALARTQLFQGKWVEDAVMRYLHRRVAAGN